jgi:hypothetical protein
MNQYKVESLIYYSKITSDKNHIIRTSTNEIQEILDEYSLKGWKLISTDVSNFGSAMYFYLYFGK